MIETLQPAKTKLDVYADHKVHVRWGKFLLSVVLLFVIFTMAFILPWKGLSYLLDLSISAQCPQQSACLQAENFLSCWQKDDLPDMYSLFSSESKQNQSLSQFEQSYQEITREATIRSITGAVADLNKISSGSQTSTIPARLTISTAALGNISESNLLHLVHESGKWHIQWSPSLIFPQLQAGDSLKLTLVNSAHRGRILDTFGDILAEDSTVYTIGVVPDQITNQQNLLLTLHSTLSLNPNDVQAKYESYPTDWYVPITTVTPDIYQSISNLLASIQGIVIHSGTGRMYPYGESFAPVTGYTGQVSPADIQSDLTYEYEAGDNIGKAGIEAWGEQYLRPVKGGELDAITPDGKTTVIYQKSSADGNDIYTTIHPDLQQREMSELSQSGHSGAMVVTDHQNGDVLAMVSWPSYDPNQLSLGISQSDWEVLIHRDQPLVNRATSILYPGDLVQKMLQPASLNGSNLKDILSEARFGEQSGIPGVPSDNDVSGTIISEQSLESGDWSQMKVTLMQEAIFSTAIIGDGSIFQPTLIHEIMLANTNTNVANSSVVSGTINLLDSDQTTLRAELTVDKSEQRYGISSIDFSTKTAEFAGVSDGQVYCLVLENSTDSLSGATIISDLAAHGLSS